MILLDGLFIWEELVIDVFNMSMQDILLVGGLVGDDQYFVDIQIYCNGCFYSSVVVFMLININCYFDVFSYYYLVFENDKLVVI